ncbi:MAG: hypothetical protein R3C56_37150 [Pirellulaceae bacterium]
MANDTATLDLRMLTENMPTDMARTRTLCPFRLTILMTLSNSSTRANWNVDLLVTEVLFFSGMFCAMRQPS